MRLLLCLAVLAGCGSPTTQLLIEICTDYDASEIGTIRAMAVDADDPVASEVVHDWAGSALEGGALSFGVEGARDRRVRVTIEIRDPSDALLVERTVETNFAPGETVRGALRLPRACEGAMCGEQTCGDFGVCESVAVPLDAWPESLSVCQVDDPMPRCDRDEDGVESAACGGADCDDDDPDRFPGNTELCDAVDQDCDPCTVGSRDGDMDGATSRECTNPGATDASCGDDVVVAGDIASGTDCNDDDAMARPGADERCNDGDDDCDGVVDEGFATSVYWIDDDDDGYGDGAMASTESCTEPDGYANNDRDCADGDASRNPDAAELCNDIDDDCDGTTDEIAGNTFYRDDDDDGFGDDGVTRRVDSCVPPAGYVSAGGDCRPDDADSYPGATELCDGLDNDCSMATPGGPDSSEDADGDEHAPLTATCTGGYPIDDCDDANPYAFPGAPEYCSGTDADCDEAIDESVDAQCASGSCDSGCFEERRVAVGGSAACHAGATVTCWGDMGGVLTSPSSVPVTIADVPATQVAMTADHGCARATDGTVRCWGANDNGQLGLGTTAPVADAGTPSITDVTQVAAAWSHSCALRRNGEVWCWGKNDFGELGVGDRDPHRTPTRVPSLDRIVELEAAAYTTCARRYDGEVFCWGYSGVGDHDANSEVPLSILSGARQISLGGEGSAFGAPHDVIGCAELADGWSCWGGFLSGARGSAATTPSTLTPLPNATDVSPSIHRSCGVATDGTVRCWGRERRGLLGTPADSATVTTVDVPNIDDAVHVDCGERMCCAQRTGRVTCWGEPDSVIHGDGLFRDGTAAETVARLTNVDEVAIGAAHACAIESGELYCWGTATSGALGHGDSFDRYEPIGLGLDAVEVDTARRRTCARAADGRVWCWSQGSAGDAAETSSSNAPLAVDTTTMGPASAIAVGEFFTCALDSLGAAWCWGSDAVACGNGGPCRTPVPVSGGRTYDEIAAGEDHACARDGGAIWCWGRGTRGQLGNGAADDSTVPVPVVGIIDAEQLAAGRYSTCVRHATGAVSCWGEGSAGELGYIAAAPLDQSMPVSVVGLTDALDLVCDRGCFALSSSSGWVAWGEGAEGRLGVGSNDDAHVPIAAAHGIDFVEVATGADSTCGLTTGGTLRCWGATGASTAWRMRGHPIFGDVTLP